MISKPPTPLQPAGYAFKDSVFLAGSIEMGTAVNWQGLVGRKLEANGWDVYNPRRDDWDSTWKQSPDNPDFKSQVEWELDALERCEAAVFYFMPGTRAPITLMEFGLHAPRSKMTALVCPEAFWRSGNVYITAQRYGIEWLSTLDATIEYLGKRGDDHA